MLDPELYLSMCLLLSVLSVPEAVLECSQTHACSSEVINCQCGDDQVTLLLWRVFRAGESSVLFSEQYTTTSSVGDSDTRGDYSVVLNSTEPLSSQLSLTISQPAITVQCALMSTISTTLQRIDAPPSPPVNLQSQRFGDLMVTLSWEAPLKDSFITGYLVNVTELESGFSQQLRTSNTSVSIHLNSTEEYLAQVMAMNCAGASQYESLVFTSTTTAEGRATTVGTTTFTSAVTTRSTLNNSHEDTKSTENRSTTATTALSTGGLQQWHIGVIVGGAIILIVCITIIVTVAYILKGGKQRKESCEATFQQDGDEYNHINHITFQKNEEEDYSTLNHTVLNEKEEENDNYDYCTVRSAQPSNKKVPKPKDKIPEMSGSYSLIGPDFSTQESSCPNSKKKDSVRSGKDLKVEYAEIQIKTKPEDNLLDLDCLLILIRDVASKWEELANEFSTPKDEIDHIRKTTVEDYDRLVEVCDWWIKQLYEKNSQPTWRALSKALKRIGYADLAKEIMEIYKTGKLPERVNAGPDVPDVLASIAAGQASPPPLPPYTASVATPATPSASAMASEFTYDDVISATAKSTEVPAPTLLPPISSYDDTIVNETPPPLPPPISSYDDTVVNKAPPPLPPPISTYNNTTENGGPPLPPKHF